MKLRPHLLILPFLVVLLMESLESGCSSNNPVSSGGSGSTVHDTLRDTLRLPGDTVKQHDTIIVDTNHTGLLTGTIKGSVQLYDTGCEPIPGDQSGVNISVEGTSIQTTSGSDGKYTLANVPSGILTIRYTKPGFGLIRNRNFQFIGGGTYYLGGPEPLWLTSPHTATTNPVTMTTTQGITTYTFSGTITDLAPNTKQRPNGWFFISRSPLIDYTDRSTYLGAYIGFSDGSNGMTSQVSTPFLFGLQPGETAYIAFFVGISCNQSQIDGGDGITDYISLSPVSSQQGQKFVVQQ